MRCKINLGIVDINATNLYLFISVQGLRFKIKPFCINTQLILNKMGFLTYV